MVAKLFVHNPNPLEYTVVNHIDGNKINNHYTNLEWVTVTENNKHAIMNNLSCIIQKLTDDEVRQIRQDFLNDLYSIKELSEKYDVSTSTIRHLIVYRTWKSVDAHLCESYLILIEHKFRKRSKKNS